VVTNAAGGWGGLTGLVGEPRCRVLRRSRAEPIVELDTTTRANRETGGCCGRSLEVTTDHTMGACPDRRPVVRHRTWTDGMYQSSRRFPWTQLDYLVGTGLLRVGWRLFPSLPALRERKERTKKGLHRPPSRPRNWWRLNCPRGRSRWLRLNWRDVIVQSMTPACNGSAVGRL